MHVLVDIGRTPGRLQAEDVGSQVQAEALLVRAGRGRERSERVHSHLGGLEREHVGRVGVARKHSCKLVASEEREAAVALRHGGCQRRELVPERVK